MFEFSVSVDDIIQHHHPKYSVLSCFCTQHSAFNECPCFCLLTIHPLIALSPGVNIYLILTPAVMILQFPATTNSAAVNIFPWDSCEDLSGIQTTIFLLQLSMCSLWNRKPVHLVIFFFCEKVRLLQSFSGGRMVSRWDTDMNLQEARTPLFIKQLLHNFSPLFHLCALRH
jgi:hypothetical protein